MFVPIHYHPAEVEREYRMEEEVAEEDVGEQEADARLRKHHNSEQYMEQR